MTGEKEIIVWLGWHYDRIKDETEIACISNLFILQVTKLRVKISDEDHTVNKL